MKLTFLEFCKSVRGYEFYNKVTHQQVFKYELYWSNYTLHKCLEKFDVVMN